MIFYITKCGLDLLLSSNKNDVELFQILINYGNKKDNHV